MMVSEDGPCLNKGSEMSMSHSLVPEEVQNLDGGKGLIEKNNLSPPIIKDIQKDICN